MTAAEPPRAPTAGAAAPPAALARLRDIIAELDQLEPRLSAAGSGDVGTTLL